jgi:surface protein
MTRAFVNNEEFKAALADWFSGDQALKDAVIVEYGTMTNWDTVNVTDMSRAFQNNTNIGDTFADPDQIITNWNTSNVTDMSYMFSNTSKFNQPLNFNTGKVTDMSYMFSVTSKFNQPLNFNTGKVTDMSDMFSVTSKFNQPLNFNTEKVIDMSYMFTNAVAFNSTINFSDTSKVKNMSSMFDHATMFNQPLNFDTSLVEDMIAMFNETNNFNQLLEFDTKNVTNMTGMFNSSLKFNKPVNFNTSNVTYMAFMFGGAAAFNQPIDFDTKNVTDMAFMFGGAAVFNSTITFSDTSNVTKMDSMFFEAVAFNQPIDFNTIQVSTMKNMFYKARGFDQPLDFNTKNVTDMEYMFYKASAFKQDISNWDTSKVKVMLSMFTGSGIQSETLLNNSIWDAWLLYQKNSQLFAAGLKDPKKPITGEKIFTQDGVFQPLPNVTTYNFIVIGGGGGGSYGRAERDSIRSRYSGGTGALVSAAYTNITLPLTIRIAGGGKTPSVDTQAGGGGGLTQVFSSQMNIIAGGGGGIGDSANGLLPVDGSATGRGGTNGTETGRGGNFNVTSEGGTGTEGGGGGGGANMNGQTGAGGAGSNTTINTGGRNGGGDGGVATVARDVYGYGGGGAGYGGGSGGIYSSPISITSSGGGSSAVLLGGFVNSYTYPPYNESIYGLGGNTNSSLSDGQDGYVLITWNLPNPTPSPTPTPTPIPISNICFPAGTPIQTDQGLVRIDKLDTRKHTINQQPILHVTQTTTIDNYLIAFAPHSIERNYPTHTTLMSKDHLVMYNGILVPAYRFLNFSAKNITKVKYSGELLYNVLLAKHSTMRVNNLICETLNPHNMIAKLYTGRFDELERNELIHLMNDSLERKDYPMYKNVVQRINK